MNWTSTSLLPPPNGVFVHTMIRDEKGERNHQKMKLQNNLWFCEDGTYVYYTPTHWMKVRELERNYNWCY